MLPKRTAVPNNVALIHCTGRCLSEACCLLLAFRTGLGVHDALYWVIQRIKIRPSPDREMILSSVRVVERTKPHIVEIHNLASSRTALWSKKEHNFLKSRCRLSCLLCRLLEWTSDSFHRDKAIYQSKHQKLAGCLARYTFLWNLIQNRRLEEVQVFLTSFDLQLPDEVGNQVSVFRAFEFAPQSFLTIFHAVKSLIPYSFAILLIERTDFFRMFLLMTAITLGHLRE